MSHFFGLVIDEDQTPGLYESVDLAKETVEGEIMAHYGETWETQNMYVSWSFDADRIHERPCVFDGNDDYVADFDYVVWELWLHV